MLCFKNDVRTHAGYCGCDEVITSAPVACMIRPMRFVPLFGNVDGSIVAIEKGSRSHNADLPAGRQVLCLGT